MPEAPGTPSVHRIGLISDTHGKLDERVQEAFEGVERIVHAGDVGRADVLWVLQTIAPVIAVSGNVDIAGMPGEELPGLASLEVAGRRISIVHIRQDLPRDALLSSDVVVFGHSHMPLVQEIEGTLWVNPGSASQPRRSPIGRSVGILEIEEGLAPRARIVALNELEDRA